MDVIERFSLRFPETTDSLEDVLDGALEYSAEELSTDERAQLVRDIRWIGLMTDSARNLKLRAIGWTYLPDNQTDEYDFFSDLASTIAAIDGSDERD